MNEKYTLFNLAINLLNINTGKENNSDFEEIIQTIEKYPENKIITSHKYGFIFKAFQNLINKKITEEEFIQTGDINKKIHKHRQSSQEIIDKMQYEKLKNKNPTKKLIFILDKKTISNRTINNIIIKKKKKEQNKIYFLE